MGAGEDIETLLITANLRCYRWLLFAVISRSRWPRIADFRDEERSLAVFSWIISEISEAYRLAKSGCS
jgi:hypothetical protein